MKALRCLAIASWPLTLCALAPLCAQQASWQQLHNQVAELVAQNRASEMLSIALQELRVAESTFGVMHPATAASTYDVALAYDTLRQYAEAETFYRRALTLEEKTLGQNSLEIPKCLNNLAGVLITTHRETDAAPLLQRSIALLRQSSDPTAQQNSIAPLINLAGIYRNQKNYAEAEARYREALAIAERDNSPGHVPSGMILYPLATLYDSEGKHHEAEVALKRALTMSERTYGPDKPETEKVLHALGATEANLRNYPQAESYLQRALQIEEQTSGTELEIAALSNDLANVYHFQEKYSAEEVPLRRTLTLREKLFGPSDPRTIDTLMTLAVLLQKEGRPADARPLCQRAVALQGNTQGSDSPALVDALSCAGSTYLAQDNFAGAEEPFRRAIRILEEPKVNEPAQLANTMNSLAEVYRRAGRFADAEPLYRESLEITNRISGQDNADYSRTLNNLGLLYADEGRFADAEPLHKQSLAIAEKVIGPDKLETTYILNSLAQVYLKTGRYAEAEPLYRRALRVREAVYGLDHPLVGTIVNNLASAYFSENRCKDAEPLQRRALAIDEKALGPEHPVVAIDLTNLGRMWQCLGRDAEAGKAYSRAVEIVEKALGPNHPDVISPLEQLASFYYVAGDFTKAAPLFDRLLAAVEYQFRYQFSYMSERDRLSFLATVDDVFPRYFSFCVRYQDRDPSLAGRMYDLTLWEKGLVARSVVSLRSQIAAAGNAPALAALQHLTVLKARLSTLELDEAQHPGRSREEIAQRQREINDLETDLVRRSSKFADRQRLDDLKWQAVSKALRPDECAIELLRFRMHDGKDWQRVEYVALVLRPGTAAPKIISLGDASMLEGAPLSDYRERVSGSRAPDESVGSVFYRNLWKPFEPFLQDTKRIYLSPDGLLSEVSWGVLPDGAGHLLCERYQINLLSSTRDLVNKPMANAARTAVLVGAPDFDLSPTAYRAALQKTPTRTAEGTRVAALTPAALRGVETNGQPLSALPATKEELQALQELLQQHGWTTTVYTGQQALEENVKALHSPRVLHLATHGFFHAPAIPADTKAANGQSPPVVSDPMLDSGVYLAGANQLAGKSEDTGLDDGVLTAFEASTLDLSNTELVVLSACETGLGVTRNGEGVFGLRRALQEAGAKAVLMSLWKVPDQETEELMKLFYGKWLSGEDKQKALREAQLEMRERVKSRRDGEDVPFFWGAFVLVGN